MGFIVAIMCNTITNMYYRPTEDEVKQRFELIEDRVVIYTVTIKYEDESKYCDKSVTRLDPDPTRVLGYLTLICRKQFTQFWR